jgi:hypothetical protein
MQLNKILAAAVVMWLGDFAGAAQAAPVVVAFNGPQTQQTSYSESGVNFSANFGRFWTGRGLVDGSFNGYFGDQGVGQVITVDMGGAAFDLVSLFNRHDHGDSLLTASNGATFLLPYGHEGTTQFFSSAFSNITWFTFETQSHLYMDNLTLNASNASVPAPGALTLLGLGLLGLGGLRRKVLAAKC